MSILIRQVVTFVCMAGCTAAAQTSARTPELRARPAAEQGITLPVFGSGDALGVLVDGHPLPASAFSVIPSRPRLMFLLDAINADRVDLVQSQQQLAQFLRGQGIASYEAEIWIVGDYEPRFRGGRSAGSALMPLDNRGLWVYRSTMTRDAAALAAELETYTPQLSRLRAMSSGAAEQQRLSLEALSFVLRVQNDLPGSKLLLYLSPGWPRVHVTSTKETERVFASLIYYADLLRTSGVVLSVLDFPATDDIGARREYREYLKVPAKVSEADANDLLLPVLATHSGGTVMWDSNDLQAGMASFVRDAGTLSLLSFSSPAPTGKPHFYPVEATAHGTTLRTVAGFYGR